MLPGERVPQAVLVDRRGAHGDERLLVFAGVGARAGPLGELPVGELHGSAIELADDDEAGRDRQAAGETGERCGLASGAPRARGGGIVEPEDRLVLRQHLNGVVHHASSFTSR